MDRPGRAEEYGSCEHYELFPYEPAANPAKAGSAGTATKALTLVWALAALAMVSFIAGAGAGRSSLAAVADTAQSTSWQPPPGGGTTPKHVPYCECSESCDTQLKNGRFTCKRANVAQKCVDPVNQQHIEAGEALTECRQLVGDDDCADMPCKNGGVCIDGDGSYTCDCPAGWLGSTCEKARFVSYTVMLHTRQVGTSGTVNPVYVRLQGEEGHTREQLVSHGGVESNATLAATILDIDIGNVTAVSYRAAGPDNLFLEYINVVSQGTSFVNAVDVLPVSQWHVAVSVAMQKGSVEDVQVALKSEAKLLQEAEAFVQGNVTIAGLNPELFFTDPTLEVAYLNTLSAISGAPTSQIVLTVVGAEDGHPHRAAPAAKAGTTTKKAFIALTVLYQIALSSEEDSDSGGGVRGLESSSELWERLSSTTADAFLGALLKEALRLNADTALRSNKLFLTPSLTAEEYTVPELPEALGNSTNSTIAAGSDGLGLVARLLD